MAWQHVYVLCAQDNLSYLVFDREMGHALVVDPTDPERVERSLKTLGLKPAAILNTHSHPDHTQGNERLAKAYSIPVYGPAREAEAIPMLRYPIEGGQILDLAGISIKVHDTPGHTRGGLTFEVEHEALITGDTLFFLGCGNPNVGGNVEVLFETFKRVYAQLPGHLMVLPGHDYSPKNLSFLKSILPDFYGIDGLQKKMEQAHSSSGVPFSTLEDERENNPFLMVFSPKLAQQIASSVGLDPHDSKACFLKLRELRNTF
jgi:hydroxyacylglutathione hydrolase